MNKEDTAIVEERIFTSIHSFNDYHNNRCNVENNKIDVQVGELTLPKILQSEKSLQTLVNGIIWSIEIIIFQIIIK